MLLLTIKDVKLLLELAEKEQDINEEEEREQALSVVIHKLEQIKKHLEVMQ